MGIDCLFLDDGSLISYDPGNLILAKFDNQLRKIWSLQLHVHHGMKFTAAGDILVNSSHVKDFQGQKKIRFDEILLIGQDGAVKKRFSFADHPEALGDPEKFRLFDTQWDPNLDFIAEISHVASSYEVGRDLYRQNEVFAPAGSFLITINSDNGPGVYVLNQDMTAITAHYPFSEDLFHDVQPYSDHQLLYLVNDNMIEEGVVENSYVVLLDLNTGEKTRSPDLFYSIYSGSVQYLGNNQLMIKDGGSYVGEVSNNWAFLEGQDLLDAKEEEFRKRKERIVFFSLPDLILDELHFDFKFHEARLENLKSFMEKNIGL